MGMPDTYNTATEAAILLLFPIDSIIFLLWQSDEVQWLGRLSTSHSYYGYAPYDFPLFQPFSMYRVMFSADN